MSKYAESAKQKQEDIHPTQTLTDYFPIDSLLRKRGFRIHSRNGEGVLWEYKGEVYTQDAALRTIDPAEIKRAIITAERVEKARYK